MASLELSDDLVHRLQAAAVQQGTSIETLLESWVEGADDSRNDSGRTAYQHCAALLDYLYQEGWTLTGQALFETLVLHLAQSLEVAHVFIAEIVDNQWQQARTLAFCQDGRLVENITYDLAHTPCIALREGGIQYYPSQVQQAFPLDQTLIEMCGESYIGMPLNDAQGNLLGLIGLIDRKPMPDALLPQSLMKLVALRAAAELERQKKEKLFRALQESEARLRQAAYVARLGIWDWDANTDQTVWSGEMFNIYGISPETFTGKGDDYFNFTHPEDRARQQVNVGKAFERGVKASDLEHNPDSVRNVPLDPKEFRVVRPDGTICYVLGDALAVIGDDGKPQRMIGTLLDITEQKLAQEKLRRQNQELETLSELALAVTSSLQLENVIDILFDSLEKLVPFTSASLFLKKGEGFQITTLRNLDRPFTEEEVIELTNHVNRGSAALNLFSTSQQPLVAGDVRQLATWQPHPLQEYIRSWMGVPLIYREQTIGVLNLDHKEVNFYTLAHAQLAMAVAAQATAAIANAQLFGEVEHLVVERTLELMTAKEQLEVIIQNSADAILLTDPDAQILFVNPAWERLTGYTLAEAIGQNPRLLQSGETSLSTYEVLWETVLKGEVWRGTLRNKRKDGQLYYAELTVAPVLNEAGEVVYMVGIQRDVTKLREVELMKAQFIANAAHDLNNPIASLLLRLDLLKRHPQHLDDHIKKLEFQINRLAALVRDLLTISRLDRGMLEVNLKPLDLNRVVQAVIDGQELLAEQKQLQLVFVPEENLPLIQADEDHLERAVLNLVSNAINYTLAGGSVQIETNLNFNKVILQVRDTGIGIDPQDLEHIFDRFYRTSNARQSSIGTGLGLSIVKEVVELHHADIEVHSQLGVGTQFTIKFPCA